jgi:hypothetical protein
MVLAFACLIAVLCVSARADPVRLDGDTVRRAVAQELREMGLNAALAEAGSQTGLLVAFPYEAVGVLLHDDVGLPRESAELLVHQLVSNPAVRASTEYPAVVESVLLNTARLNDWALVATVLYEAERIALPGVERALLQVSERIVGYLTESRTASYTSLYARAGLAVAAIAPVYPSLPLAELLVTISERSRVAALVEGCRAAAESILRTLGSEP